MREICDEQRRKHEQVCDRLINGLRVDQYTRHGCGCWLVLRHGQLHEPREEEGREQQHVHLHGHHLRYFLLTVVVGAERIYLLGI